MSEGRNQGGGEGAERDPALDRLYRAGAHEEPPAHLDSAILAAARREVGARPRPLSARLRAWRVPVSIAALVVLSVSLVTLVQEEGGDQLAQPSLESARRAEPAPAEPASRPSPAAQAEAETRNAPARQVEKARAADSRADSTLGATAPAAADDRARRRAAEEPAGLSSAEVPPAPPSAAARPAPQPFPAAPTPERAARSGAAEPGASADMAARSYGSRAPVAEDRAVSPERPAPAVRPPAQMRDAAPAGELAGAASGAPRAPAATAPAERPRARVQAQLQKKEGPALDAAYVAGLIKEFDSQPPEKWLERIEALRREGRAADADEMLAEFKRRFPAHPLPEALR